MRINWQKSFFLVVGLLIGSLSLSGCSLTDLQELKIKSGLQVITNDNQPAALFLNGEYLEKTPFINKNIKPGIYSLKIQPTNQSLVPYETQVTLNAGTLTVVTWSPGKTPETSGGVIYELQETATKNSKAELNFLTIPDSAIITVDNQPQTFSPLSLDEVEPGNHEFEVKLPSYTTQKHTLNAVAGKKLQVTVKLAKQEMISLVPTQIPAIATITSGNKNPNLEAVANSSAMNVASLSAKITPRPNELISQGTSQLKNGQKVLITKTGLFQNDQEVLRVRAEASANGKQIGLAIVGQTYTVTQPAFDGWVQIQLNPTTMGWVNQNYLKAVTE